MTLFFMLLAINFIVAKGKDNIEKFNYHTMTFGANKQCMNVLIYIVRKQLSMELSILRDFY